MALGVLRIEPMTPGHVPALDELFTRGDPRNCQCSYLRMVPAAFDAATAAERRELHLDAITSAHREGAKAGHIALDDHGPVGWVSLGPRSRFPRLDNLRLLNATAAELPAVKGPLWSVVCFVIATRARRRGVATALLRAVVDWAGGQEIAVLEGYPVDTEGQKRPGAALWHGTVRMFEAAGFEVVARHRESPQAYGRAVVRRDVLA
ncbi:MAG: GNAT family N-acetyltransferase [Microlunatus sp.]|nr:GNAT family N-acetyltransferase [Microlunatus sp.]MDN5770566.1 GNAT family N-acetyltransferase [Microlunatus sp.]